MKTDMTYANAQPNDKRPAGVSRTAWKDWCNAQQIADGWRLVPDEYSTSGAVLVHRIVDSRYLKPQSRDERYEHRKDAKAVSESVFGVSCFVKRVYGGIVK